MALPVRLDVYHTSIPMRSFEHAAARRDLAEAVVVRMELSDGSVGYGETLPRPYVTGETIDGVVGDLREIIWPALAGRNVETDAALPELPSADTAGRCINAAACAAELAVMDAIARPVSEPIAARVSGVIGSADPARTDRQLRLMRWFGLRDFKLKLGLGDEVDLLNLGLVQRRLGRAVAAGKCSLRVDANGAWDAADAPGRIASLKRYGVCVVEQPLRCGAAELVELARRCELPLMADESLLTRQDAQTLLAERRRIWWNVRISKNGGFTRALELADLAARHGVKLTIGCMVGESAILSAAQRRLLQRIASPAFVEGNYGRFLLADDLAAGSIRFGYAGRLKALKGPGLGVVVDEARLRRYGKLLATVTA